MAYKFEETGSGEVVDKAPGVDRGETTGDRWGLFSRFLEAAGLVAVVAAGVLFALPRYQPAPTLVIAASVIGASIAFTGVLVPCVMLLIWRTRAANVIEAEEFELRRELDRGRAIASLIRRERQRLGADGQG
jgi:hypothetical protein